MKKLVSLLIIFCILFAIISLTTMAQMFPAPDAVVEERGVIVTPPQSWLGCEGGELSWRLYDDETLVIEGGFIRWWDDWQNPWRSPWHNYRSWITQIVIEDSVEGGVWLNGLFSQLWNVTHFYGIENIDTSATTDMSLMFYGMRDLITLDLSSWNVENVTRMDSMFEETRDLQSLNLSGWNVENVRDMQGMFAGTINLTDLNLSGWNPLNVRSMGSMFWGVSSLTNLDLSSWNVGNVTRMNHMFSGMNSLETLNLSGWNTTNVTEMRNMFANTNNLINLNTSGWNTRNVSDMSNMFRNASSLKTLDLSHFDTRNVSNMSSMFSDMNNLTNLDISGWDTRNVSDMSWMFGNASSLENLDLSHFDTRNVSRMNNMFSGANSLTRLDISSFDMRNITDMWNMFSNTTSLRELVLGDRFNFIFGGGWGVSDLPDPPINMEFSGRWQRADGTFVFTSQELQANFVGSTHAGTWVWQQAEPVLDVVYFAPFSAWMSIGWINRSETSRNFMIIASRFEGGRLVENAIIGNIPAPNDGVFNSNNNIWIPLEFRNNNTKFMIWCADTMQPLAPYRFYM